MMYQKVGKIYNNNNNCKIYNQTFLSFLAVLPDGFFNSRHSVVGPGILHGSLGPIFSIFIKQQNILDP